MTRAWCVRLNGNCLISVSDSVSIATSATSGAVCPPRTAKRTSTVSRSEPRNTSNAHSPSTTPVVARASVA